MFVLLVFYLSSPPMASGSAHQIRTHNKQRERKWFLPQRHFRALLIFSQKTWAYGGEYGRMAVMHVDIRAGKSGWSGKPMTQDLSSWQRSRERNFEFWRYNGSQKMQGHYRVALAKYWERGQMFGYLNIIEYILYLKLDHCWLCFPWSCFSP